MKVKDLIEKLYELDPEAELLVKSKDPEIRGPWLVEYEPQFEEIECSKETRRFTDFFTKESYNKEVWSKYGDQQGVLIY